MDDSQRRLDGSPEARGTEAAATPGIEDLTQMLAAERQRAHTAEHHLAIQLALMDDRLLRVERNRIFSAWNSAVSRLNDFRRRFKMHDSAAKELRRVDEDYAAWVANEAVELPDPQQAMAISQSWESRPLVTLAMRAGPRPMEIATLRAIAGQLYERWEVCLEAGSEDAARQSGLPESSIRYVAGSRDQVAHLSSCAAVAGGEYLWSIEPGDVLSPYALYYAIQAIQQTHFAVIYTDEDCHRAAARLRPVFKPDWSPSLLASRMYLGRAFLTATSEVRGFLSAAPAPSADWRHDLLRHAVAADLSVHHVSRVLYHRADESQDAEVEPPQRVPLPVSPTRRTARAPSREVGIVICSRSADLVAKCLDSIKATAGAAAREVVVVSHEPSGPNSALRTAIERRGASAIPFAGRFNYSVMNNLAVEKIASRNILFLNDDVTASEPGWLECLLEQIEDQGAAIAGATLWYPSGVLQHAGIVSGSGDGVVHIGRYSRSSVLWPWLRDTREVSAVTGACLCIPAELFRSLGGFDVGFPNNYNDVDLCFRARAEGRRVVCVAVPGLVHVECVSRPGIVRFEERYRFFRMWDSVLSRPDPYYSPNLAPTEKIQLNLEDPNGFRALGRSSGR
jgi:O-antigen biosynthesis protein